MIFQGKAKEKVDLMLQLLGYPEWVQSEEGIDEFYNGVIKNIYYQISNIQILIFKVHLNSALQF